MTRWAQACDHVFPRLAYVERGGRLVGICVRCGWSADAHVGRKSVADE